jgi:hypoxanthine-DNA glycosylase
VSTAGYTHIKHEFDPVFDENSRVLILGTAPSVKSRETGFYYGNAQNRFWRVTAAVIGCPVPETVSDKKFMLISHGIALWDVIDECDIIGSSDSSIRNVKAVDIKRILNVCADLKIFGNGGTAVKYYRRLLQSVTGKEITPLPSTSPANAAWSFDRLCEKWRGQIGEYISPQILTRRKI